jgi:hypothetical protein
MLIKSINFDNTVASGIDAHPCVMG